MFSCFEAISVFFDSFITLGINHLPRTFAPCCRRRIWGKLKIMQSAELCKVIILISPHDWKEMTDLKFRFWKLSSVSGVFEDLGTSSQSSFYQVFKSSQALKSTYLVVETWDASPVHKGLLSPSNRIWFHQWYWHHHVENPGGGQTRGPEVSAQ